MLGDVAAPCGREIRGLPMQAEHLGSYERVPLSPATRALLCTFAAGDLQRPLPCVDADWAEVFQGVCRNGLLGLTYRYLHQGLSRDYPPAAFRDAIQQARYREAVGVALLYRGIRTVLTQFTAAGLDFLVLKGPALAQQVYPHPSLRTFSDLDLMVHERDLWAIQRALLEAGFIAEDGDALFRPKLVPQATIYELKYWHPTLQLRVEVHADDLLNAGLASRDLAGFWARVDSIALQGVPVKVLSLEDQLIHLCAHLHYHGYVRLNWFADLAFLVRDQAARLDWEQILATVRREEAQVAVYYSLHFLQQVLGVDPPAPALAALRPDRFRRWWHERYLPERRVLSLAPMPRPDFSFYFVPLLKRLLPDLLVMGRRREKLRYLLHVLLPPPAWLRAYYRIADARPVAPHYLLHPLKLLVHYLAEVASAGTTLGRRLTRRSRREA
jgi:hypothetical protein